jgi:hypothetical protein
MLYRFLTFCFLLASMSSVGSSSALAQSESFSSGPSLTDDSPVTGGFARPYEFERQAYGYDPDGIEYKENQAEDFQVVFISSAPFAALASFGLTSFTSLIFRNSFSIDGDYFLPFLVGTAVGATTIASVSVLTNKYPAPPPFSSYSEKTGEMPPLAFKMTIFSTEF